MTTQRQEGDMLAGRYLLGKHQENLERNGSVEPALGRHAWVATDTTNGHTVSVEIQTAAPISADALNARLQPFAALIHPLIIRTLDVQQLAERELLLITAHNPKLRTLNEQKLSPRESLALMLKVIDTLQYAHGLGLTHGNLSFSQLFTDQQGNIHIGGFGIPPTTEDLQKSHLSPQVRRGLNAQIEDDVYSLGTLLNHLLKGEQATLEQPGNTLIPIPAQLQTCLANMLAEDPWERPGSLSVVTNAIREFLEPNDNTQIKAVSFAVAQTSKVPDESTHPADPGVFQKEPALGGVDTSKVLTGLMILVAVSIAIFIFLPAPDHAPVTQDEALIATPQVPEAVSTQPGPAPFELARREYLRKQVDESAAELLRTQLELEDAGGLLWATNELEESQKLADEGDRLFRNENHDGAMAQFTQGLNILKPLLENLPETLVRHLDKGAASLAENDAEAAQTAFKVANSIDPYNESAIKGMKRASALEKIIDLLASATPLEKAGNLADALTISKQALTIDAKSKIARTAVNRISGMIADQNFQSSMSNGFAALREGDYSRAIDQFNKAKALKADSSQPAEGLAQVELADRLGRIEDFKRQAEQFAADEDWSSALTTYQSALDLDGSLLFATKGLAHARKQHDLSKNLLAYIEHPLDMKEPEQLDNAKKILYRASLVSNPGPKLSRQIRDLSRQIKLARTPIQLELRSDEQTNIIIYKVAELGRLRTTNLELYPGIYTIVGTRRGYRDVRQKITLLAGQAPAPVEIRCSEKI